VSGTIGEPSVQVLAFNVRFDGVALIGEVDSSLVHEMDAELQT